MQAQVVAAPLSTRLQLQKDKTMKKLVISTSLSLLAILPATLLSTAVQAREVIRVERPAADGNGVNGAVVERDGEASVGDNIGNDNIEANNGIGEGVQDGVVDHPVADAEAVRTARENADDDDDNDGIINGDDNDDDNDGVPDADENGMGASSNVGAQP